MAAFVPDAGATAADRIGDALARVVATVMAA